MIPNFVSLHYFLMFKSLKDKVQLNLLSLSYLDEEIGGHLGMELFVHMKEFKDLHIGFVLDEGGYASLYSSLYKSFSESETR